MNPLLTLLRKYGANSLVVCLTLALSLFVMSLYVEGPLNGNFDHHVMTAKRFGQPAELREHGLTSLYRTKEDKGWDGQFYYFMANDILATKDSAQHMDSDAYRYQRIGLPLVAKALSLVLLQDWVSPALYYASSLLLVLMATLYGAAFLQRRGVAPFYILFWSLAAGTQLTMMNGLPDAAADAMLIIALTALLDHKLIRYALAMTLAVLTREAYMLLPFFIAVASVLYPLRDPLQRRLEQLITQLRTPGVLVHLIPLLAFGLWQGWVRLRFSGTPVEQAQGILGLPLVSLWQHLIAGLAGHYPGLAAGDDSYFAAINLLFFLGLLLLSLLILIRLLRSGWQSKASPLVMGIGAGFFALSLLYLHFGVTVIWHFSGFMKAAAILGFVLPLCYALQGKKFPALMILFLCIMTLYFGFRLWDFRLRWSAVLPLDDVRCEAMAFPKDPANCLSKFVWRGNQLALQLGHVSGTAVEVNADIDPAGLISFGPYIAAPKGAYRATLDYTATSPADGSAPGSWDVFSNHLKNGPAVLQTGVLAAGQTRATIDFVLEDDVPDLEVRSFTAGHSHIRIKSLSIEQLATGAVNSASVKDRP